HPGTRRRRAQGLSGQAARRGHDLPDPRLDAARRDTVRHRRRRRSARLGAGHGVLPGLGVLPHLPQVDWSWPLRHGREAVVIGAVWIGVLILFLIIAFSRFRSFKERVAQGFAILRPFSRFVTQVCSWQALSWGFRIASVYFFLEAFSVPSTLHNALLVLIVQSLATLFPFTPGGVGTQQGLLVYVFDRAGSGIEGSLLLSFSVGMYIATTILNVVVGFVALFMMVGTVRWRRILPEDDKAMLASRE